ncbi:uncharacterized protein LOC111644120 [Copidosoma floridanum]|uniref:uncharacterized protein LOC111644120 n=1 Tax=Copidosoma floridanum TaxID=29053 RepID=UPI000C6F5BA2|nr:uncharacterized protein LOC111644120 [Copidosoma floridanum]
MSKMQCRQFVQNAWKKDLCSNCFKSREEHLATQDLVKPVVVKTALSVKRVVHKVQGILRPTKEPNNSTNQLRPKRKTVAFLDSLTEIIGYDGGDDFDTEDSSPRPADQDDPDHCADTSLEPDDLPDSEEERALGNLTRANTNFNTITANLTAPPLGPALMLGRAPKPTGNKPTLLVTITPFGSDDGTVPTLQLFWLR